VSGRSTSSGSSGAMVESLACGSRPPSASAGVCRGTPPVAQWNPLVVSPTECMLGEPLVEEDESDKSSEAGGLVDEDVEQDVAEEQIFLEEETEAADELDEKDGSQQKMPEPSILRFVEQRSSKAPSSHMVPAKFEIKVANRFGAFDSSDLLLHVDLGTEAIEECGGVGSDSHLESESTSEGSSFPDQDALRRRIDCDETHRAAAREPLNEAASKRKHHRQRRGKRHLLKTTLEPSVHKREKCQKNEEEAATEENNVGTERDQTEVTGPSSNWLPEHHREHCWPGSKNIVEGSYLHSMPSSSGFTTHLTRQQLQRESGCRNRIDGEDNAAYIGSVEEKGHACIPRVGSPTERDEYKARAPTNAYENATCLLSTDINSRQAQSRQKHRKRPHVGITARFSAHDRPKSKVHENASHRACLLSDGPAGENEEDEDVEKYLTLTDYQNGPSESRCSPRIDQVKAPNEDFRERGTQYLGIHDTFTMDPELHLCDHIAPTTEHREINVDENKLENCCDELSPPKSEVEEEHDIHNDSFARDQDLRHDSNSGCNATGSSRKQRRRKRNTAQDHGTDTKSKSNSAVQQSRNDEAMRHDREGEPPVPASNAGEDRETPTSIPNKELPARVPLTDEKAKLLAMMTARMHEGAILRYMRKNEMRKCVLAVPVDAAEPECSDMLDVMLGMVAHCEAYDASSNGWAIGSIVAPREIAEQQGGFRCIGMRPILAEVRSNRFGDELEWTHSTWDQVKHLQASSTQSRLRQKALLNRVKAVRIACEAKKGA